MRLNKIYIYLITIMIFNQVELFSQPDFNITTLNNPAPGYLIFDFYGNEYFGVVDNYGYRVLLKDAIPSSYYLKPISRGVWAYLDFNTYYFYDDDMKLIDSIPNPTDYSMDFHDILVLRNGRYLILMREDVKMDLSEIVPGGQKDANIISNVLIETDKTGTVYWEWRAIDHLSITDVTDRVDLTFKNIDWTHVNSIHEDSDGNILVSVRHFDQLIKIDRQTDEIIWKIGGSASKGNQFTFINDTENGFFGFSHQHTALYLQNGNILLYDNGNLKDPQYSRAVEYSIDEEEMTATKVWEYRDTPDIYQPLMGSAFRLPNGNTLINWGSQKITEVRPDKTIAFELDYGDGMVYRAFRILYETDVVNKTINNTGEYDYNSQEYQTGVKLNVQTLSGSGNTHIQKHRYAPHSGEYADSSFSKVFPVRWVFSQVGINSLGGKISIKANAVPELSEPNKATIYKRNKEAEGIFIPLKTTYNASTNEISADFVGPGEFIVVSSIVPKPSLISPVSGSETFTSVWLKVQNIQAASHYQVQLDTNINFQNPLNDLISPEHDNKVELLIENVRYFWRARALNSKDTSAWSNAFWFKTGVSAPKLLSPENDKIAVKKTDTLKWSEINGINDYQLQIASTIDFVTVEFDTNVNINQTMMPAYMQPDKLYYWRVRAVRTADTSEWSDIFRFTTSMNPPFLSAPANKSINISSTYTFSWTQSKGAATYSLQISDTHLFENISKSETNLNQTNYQVTDLQYDKKYFWRVKSVRTTDSSEWSEINEFHTKLPAPKLISPIDGASKVSIFSTLEWEVNNQSDFYTVQISTDADFGNIVINENNFNANKYELFELFQNTKYFWRIRANRNELYSEWSKVRSFVTDSEVSISAPEPIVPINGSRIYVDGCLFWKSVPNAQYYHLQISTNEFFSNILIDEINIKINNFSFNNLQYDRIYYWRIKAKNKWAESNWSGVASFTTSDVSSSIQLSIPILDELQVPLNGQLVWDAVVGADYYQLQLDIHPDFPNPIINESNIIETIFEYDNLQPNTNYYWRVRFVQGIQTSNWSYVWNFRTMSDTHLLSPNLEMPPNKALRVDVGSHFEWKSVEGASNYKFILAKDAKFKQVILNYPNLSDTVLNCCTLEFGTNYFWRVAAFSDATSSTWSPTYNFLTELESPTIIHPINGATDIAMNPRIIWDLSKPLSTYKVQISLDENFDQIVIDRDDVNNVFFDCILEPFTKYYVRIQNYNDTNSSKWSDISSFTTSNAMSASDNDIKSTLTVYNYPNPFTVSTTFVVSTSESGLAALEIFDIYGNLAATVFSYFIERGTHKFVWPPGSLNSGVFQYRLLLNNQIVTGRLLIIN